jgi:DNA-binding helix-hairpin-helix protein with protein kinase domain
MEHFYILYIILFAPFLVRDIHTRIHTHIENIQLLAKCRGSLVAMDSNSRSTTWYYTITNRRGRVFEAFLISKRLHIANEDSARTTFESTRGTSNVDLTVADSKIVNLLNTWQCNEQEVFSDHRYINFCIEEQEYITRIRLQRSKIHNQRDRLPALRKQLYKRN